MSVSNSRIRFDGQVLADLDRRHDDVLQRLADLEQRIEALLRSVLPPQSLPSDPLGMERSDNRGA